MFRRLSDIRRLWHAARVLARNDALFPKEYEALLPAWARLTRRLLGSGRARTDAAPPGVRLARALESLGPAYIKLGQVLATRADIVGDEQETASTAIVRSTHAARQGRPAAPRVKAESSLPKIHQRQERQDNLSGFVLEPGAGKFRSDARGSSQDPG